MAAAENQPSEGGFPAETPDTAFGRNQDGGTRCGRVRRRHTPGHDGAWPSSLRIPNCRTPSPYWGTDELVRQCTRLLCSTGAGRECSRSQLVRATTERGPPGVAPVASIAYGGTRCGRVLCVGGPCSPIHRAWRDVLRSRPQRVRRVGGACSRKRLRSVRAKHRWG